MGAADAAPVSWADKTHYGTGAMLTLMWLAIGTAAVLAVASIVAIVIVEAGR